MEKPMTCKIEGNELVVRIEFDTLEYAAANCAYFWDGESGTDTPTVKVMDPFLFAEEVCRHLNNEEEDGSTLLTNMFDNGIISAVEDGCEGVAHELIMAVQRKHHGETRHQTALRYIQAAEMFNNPDAYENSDISCVEPDDYDEENPQNFPPPGGIEMVKV